MYVRNINQVVDVTSIVAVNFNTVVCNHVVLPLDYSVCISKNKTY